MGDQIGETIKRLRKEKGMTLEELGNRVGVGKSTVRKWETGMIANMRRDKIQKLADALDVDVDYLMGWGKKHFIEIDVNSVEEYNFFRNKLFVDGTIPVLGKVPCGYPTQNLSMVDMNDCVEIERSLSRTGQYYGLRANGDSMFPKIEQGDVMIVHCQSDIESGQVAIVKINGEEATCKKIKKIETGLMLISINPNYEPMFFDWQEVQDKPVEIVGRVIEVRSKL